MILLDRARAFAVHAHGDQLYGAAPYCVHLDEVAAILEPFGPEHQAAAYLHDVIEDTDVELDELRERFGDQIARWVLLVTDEPGDSRRERKRRTYPKYTAIDAQSTDAGALVIKVADRLANLRSCIRNGDQRRFQMYRDERLQFAESCERLGLCNDLWIEIGALFRANPTPSGTQV